MFPDLSFRYKAAVGSGMLIILTALVVTASLMFRAYDDLKRDVLSNAASMARVLAHTLTPLMLHDDLWRSYEIISSPLRASAQANSNQAVEIVVLDSKQNIFVSTQPKAYPVLSDPARAHPEHIELRTAITGYRGIEPMVVEPAGSKKFYMVAPIKSDGEPVGTLLIGYSRATFLPRFYDIAGHAVVITLLALAVLLPMSWYWGWLLAAPLMQLADYMGKVGATLPVPDDREWRWHRSRDEIGQVSSAFKHMLGELKEKEALQRQMFFSERLAAVGRLAAGIAHEINNPLGGMLNAISNFKKHDPQDQQTLKTIAMLERGLLQIKNTIAAILVDAKVQSHQLSVQDIEDARALVLANLNQNEVELTWENEVRETLPLPSTLVRQILINLLSNATQALESHGHLRCRIVRDADNLIATIENDGKYITSDQLEHLFEPFVTGHEHGHGLGLWVTYQIVQQLKGNIAVTSAPGETRFVVTLPIPESLA